MSLISVFALISDQFEAAARGIRSLDPADVPPPGEEDWWEKSGRRYQESFTLLAGGEGLPFFRSNYLEISGRVFLFTAGLQRLSRQSSALSIAPQEAVRECLRRTGAAFSSLRLAWCRFLEDSGRANRDASTSLPLIIALQDSISRLSSPARPSPETEKSFLSWGILSDCLFELDLALKKLIAIARI